MEDYEDLLAAAEGTFEYPELKTAACGMLSGTTGRPKGVAYSHRGVSTYFIRRCPDVFGLSMRDCILPIVPMFHKRMGHADDCRYDGFKIVFTGPHTDHESVLELLEAENVTLTGGVYSQCGFRCKCVEERPERWKLKKIIRYRRIGRAEAMIRFRQHGISSDHAWE